MGAGQEELAKTCLYKLVSKTHAVNVRDCHNPKVLSTEYVLQDDEENL